MRQKLLSKDVIEERYQTGQSRHYKFPRKAEQSGISESLSSIADTYDLNEQNNKGNKFGRSQTFIQMSPVMKARKYISLSKKCQLNSIVGSPKNFHLNSNPLSQRGQRSITDNFKQTPAVICRPLLKYGSSFKSNISPTTAKELIRKKSGPIYCKTETTLTSTSSPRKATLFNEDHKRKITQNLLNNYFSRLKMVKQSQLFKI